MIYIEQGITKIFLTKIPFFKEVAIMSFNCDQCGWANNELQPVGMIQEKGIVFSVKCSNERVRPVIGPLIICSWFLSKQNQDLNRQVVKSEWAEIKIPEVEFEVKKQNGLVTTVEGIIDRAVTGLKENLAQAIENGQNELGEKLSEFILNLSNLKENVNFTFVSIYDLCVNVK